jgi:iron complex transport system substrate-binding protein
MAKMSLLVCLVALVSLFSCSHNATQTSADVVRRFGVPDSVYSPNYASGFKINYYGTDKLIEVANPWDSTITPDYFLINNSGRSNFDGLPVVKAPVTNWSAFSSSQVVLADILDVLETLRSVAEPEYISNDFVKQGIADGRIKSVGMAAVPDMEVLLLSKPQFVFVSPFKDNQYDRLREGGLVVVPDAGYLESSPLGRAEWIVFFGAFFNLEKQAVTYFNNIENEYHNLQSALLKVSNHPSMTTGYLYQDVWFLPAGESYLATLFADAGAIYPYSKTKGTGSLALDFEKVFHDTHNSDFWILTVNHPGNFTYNDLRAMDDRYADFMAFKNKKVVCSNTHASGYFERGWMEPQTILKDLAKAFHPQLFPDYKPVYFDLIKN